VEEKTAVRIGTLSVTVMEGKNLPALDSNGMSDPYVTLSIGKVKQKTKVKEKTLNPNWTEVFKFE
jgi:Ca2+-dependent lipid-binding protein